MVSQAHGSPEEELWWEKGASCSPPMHSRELSRPHPARPDAGLSRTVPCSPVLANDSNQLLLGDLIQILPILHHIAKRKTRRWASKENSKPRRWELDKQREGVRITKTTEYKNYA